LFALLLDGGADPHQVNPDLRALVDRKPEASDVAAKTDLLLRHGADADLWMNRLFNAVADRSGLASAKHRMEREGGRLPESAKYVPVKTVWVDDLLRNPTRASDNGLEPLLREATVIRDADSCPTDAAAEALRLCLPGALTHAMRDLEGVTARGDAATPELDRWRHSRDERCALHTTTQEGSGAWQSYVLADTGRARCVVTAVVDEAASLKARGQ
jgi:hypothetical protein